MSVGCGGGRRQGGSYVVVITGLRSYICTCIYISVTASGRRANNGENLDSRMQCHAMPCVKSCAALIMRV